MIKNQLLSGISRCLCLSLWMISGTIPSHANPSSEEPSFMKITSPAFKYGEPIPVTYTCQGRDVNPEFNIENIPSATKSLVLIVDDPDAPVGNWVHWVVYNIPPCERIESDSVPGLQGKNSWGRLAYGGPCPPSGSHRYFFKLYALAMKVHLPEGASKQEVMEAMRGHILDQAEIMGRYQKS